MVDVRLLFPRLYLGAADFRGKDVTLTIRRVVVENLRTENGSTKKPVVYFEETHQRATDPKKEKRLVLNKTNAMTIAGIHGYEVDHWLGKRITLFPTQVEAFGAVVDCIRVRPQVAGPTPGAADLDAALSEKPSTLEERAKALPANPDDTVAVAAAADALDNLGADLELAIENALERTGQKITDVTLECGFGALLLPELTPEQKEKVWDWLEKGGGDG